jgi:hypothetical protein
LRQLQQTHPGRLAILASTRNRQRDFAAGVPFRRLSHDALWRMMPWFNSLRRLSRDGRAGLIARLAGHPRSVEYLDALIEKALSDWEYDNGPFMPGCLSVVDEQAQIIDPVLPALDGELSENLLFDALWDRVLNASARTLLLRAGVLRPPATATLIASLADGEAKDAIERLRRSALLSEIRETGPDGRTISLFEEHPAVTRLAAGRCDAALLTQAHQAGHRRAGDFYEQVARTSTSWQADIEAA